MSDSSEPNEAAIEIEKASMQASSASSKAAIYRVTIQLQLRTKRQSIRAPWSSTRRSLRRRRSSSRAPSEAAIQNEGASGALESELKEMISAMDG